jgi:hypothetical protein
MSEEPEPKPIEDNSLLDLYNILDKIIFELLSNSRELKALVPFVNLLMRTTKLDTNLMDRLIKERVFPPTKSLAKDEKTFIEVIVFHSEEEVRQAYSNILREIFTAKISI